MKIVKSFESVEAADVLDGVSERARKLLRRRLEDTAADGMLRGGWLGHPLHPALVVLPLGSWISAAVLDLSGADDTVVRRLLGVGLLATPFALATGWADWSTLDVRQRRVGLVHAASNAVGLSLIVASYARRLRAPDRRATALCLLGLAALGAAGALGGHLVFAQGAGARHGD
ncbi:DUF2231 domain-containing protein [Tomitella biformata]|uniref:DUF2231 domain-containing protein n=1 Tax=Tomitella biformata TaxID=630403 RepID=UPI0004B950F3|nr:DUF2231 domain-containing protein [Tomitella biformata]